MSTLAVYTAVHVLISLVGIVSGLAVLGGLLAADPSHRLTAVFLAATVLTSLTGFGFPFTRVLPSHVLGALSLVVLTVAIFARYGARLRRAWRWIYVVSAMLALYFNVFVLVVQLFEKVPALRAIAPTRSEPPFAAAQLAVLAIFAAATSASVYRFHPERGRTAAGF